MVSVALGISTEGVKIPLGLWEGSTENATLARTLLADLVDRSLDPEQAILFVFDSGKAIRRAIKDVFGKHALVHFDIDVIDFTGVPLSENWGRNEGLAYAQATRALPTCQ